MQAAVEASTAAGQLADRMRNTEGDLEILMKGAHDFVSNADKAAEQVIREILNTSFPTDAIVGEEQGGDPSDSAWIVDPIDGTSNYVQGLPDWCVSIAYTHRGITELGIIYAPLFDSLYVAVRGKGAFLNGRRISVAPAVPISQCTLEIDWSPQVPQSTFCDLIRELLAKGLDFRRHGSATLALVRVAEGKRYGFIELFSRPWDALAGELIVVEAGGWTNNFSSGLWDRRGNPIIACSPFLKEILLSVPSLAECFFDRR